MANSLLETKLLVVLLNKNCLILPLRKAFLDQLFVFFHGKIGPKGRNCGGGGEGRVLFSPSASLPPPLPPPPLSPTTSIFPRRKDKTKNKAGRKGGEKKKKKKERGISEKGRKCCLLNPGKMKGGGRTGGRKGPWHEKKFPAKVPRFRNFWSGKARFFILN